MELGSLAEFLSAFGTLAALFAATIAARAAINTNRQQGVQLEYLERANMDREYEIASTQASKVAAWIRINREGVPGVWWCNSSGLPIYGVTVYVVSPSTVSEIRYSVLGPFESPGELARASRTFVDDTSAQDSSWIRWLDQDELRVAVSFRDASRHWWFRDFSGVLSRHDDEGSVRALVSAAVDGVREREP